MDDKDRTIRRELADKVYTLLERETSERAALAVARAYLCGRLKKPLDELTDEELLEAPWVGLRTVEEIRAVVPSP